METCAIATADDNSGDADDGSDAGGDDDDDDKGEADAGAPIADWRRGGANFARADDIAGGPYCHVGDDDRGNADIDDDDDDDGDDDEDDNDDDDDEDVVGGGEDEDVVGGGGEDDDGAALLGRDRLRIEMRVTTLR